MSLYSTNRNSNSNEQKKTPSAKVIAMIAGGAIVALFGLSAVTSSIYTVDEGERAVILRNGKVIGQANPGLNFKVPFIDSTVPISVQSQARLYKNVASYSQDQQTAFLALSVSFQVPADRVAEVYAKYGSVDGMLDRLVDRQLPEKVKTVFGRFNAETAIKERDRLSAEIQQAVRSGVNGPVLVESVQLENVDFSKAYETSIEERMLAEVEVQKVSQNANREEVQARIKVIQAQADADSQLAVATAEAKAIELKGQAEAKAIAVKGQALRDNPALVGLVTAEAWNGVLPSTMVPGSAVPFVNVK